MLNERNLNTSLRDKKVLITGATGFIGGRLVETLVKDHGANVRVLISRYTNASRIARFPIEWIKADILNKDQVSEAAKGCDYIVHCAYGSRGDDEYRRATNIEGTRNIAESALEHNIKRLIHLSTVLVYGVQKEGTIDEKSSYKSGFSTYGDEKIEAEKVLSAYHNNRNLPVVILQPTAVIGPFAPVWTTNIITRLKKGKQILVNNGEGYCNYIFIDDLIEALIKALIVENIEGESFLISANKPITWGEFFGHFETMLNEESYISMSRSEARRYSKKAKKKRSLVYRSLRHVWNHPRVKGKVKSLVEKFHLREKKLPDSLKKSILEHIDDNDSKKVKPIRPISDEEIKLFESKVITDVKKSEELLSFSPVYDIDQSMYLIREWAQWSNMLEENGSR